MSHFIRKPVYAIDKNNKGTDQPAHPRSLIGAFVVRCLDSIIPLVSKPLPRFCGCAGWFESYLVRKPKDRFSHDEAHILLVHKHKCFKCQSVKDIPIKSGPVE